MTLSVQYWQLDAALAFVLHFSLVLKFCIVVTRIARQATQVENETRERDVGDAPDKA